MADKGTKKTEDVNPLDVLRDNAGLMIAVLVVLLAFATLIVWQSNQTQAANDQAWWALAKYESEHAQGTEGFDELIQSSGEGIPGAYMRITYAGRLYETGVRADVEKAKTLFEEARALSKDVPTLYEPLGIQIEKIAKELEAQPSPLLEVAPPPEAEDEGPDLGDMGFPPMGGR
ncbi:MAG: hypothetical protein R3F62_16070 [Planctomycetota bacterium]